MERSVRLNHGARLALALLTAGILANIRDGGASAEGAEGPAKACVADVDKVIATKPTDAMRTASLPADVVAKLDEAVRLSFKEAAAPGAIVGVRTPQGTWTAAYGKADPVAGTPMEVGTHTRIGSVTKTFTGTVIMQLAEAGKLSLDDPIEKYVPGVPNGRRITLRMLADMTSGVASYTRSTKFTDVYFAKPETVFTPDRVLAIGISESPLFEPGAQFDYSNTNTVLLGMVIEKVTGEPVGDVFKKMVFEPLGLKNTVWPGESTEIPAPFAQGFTLQGDYAKPDAPSNATHWNPAWGWTSGELISNMPDLLTYGRALGTGQGLLGSASQAERLKSFPGPAGYGIAAGCIDGWVGHTGELPGYNTSVFYDTTSDTTVVVQVNSDIASGDCPESPVLTDDPRDTICSSPATRIFVSLSTALGHTFTPLSQK
jgi:D-alanyl-D-alanine carboxypeptidase